MNSNPVNVGLSVDSEDLILLNDYIDLLLDPTLPTEQFDTHNYIPVPVPLCLILLQVPNIWLHLVQLQNILCRHKNQYYWLQIIFLSAKTCLWLSQYVNKFLVRQKKFGLAQNILGTVKGQSICKKCKELTNIIGDFSRIPAQILLKT